MVVEEEGPRQGIFSPLRQLLSLAPFRWLDKGRIDPRFRPGAHLHGLEEHDVRTSGEFRLGGTGIRDLPR
jgi:hypothetical protein